MFLNIWGSTQNDIAKNIQMDYDVLSKAADYL
jgi:hypothetical protein